MITENFLELVDIEEIIHTEEYENMVDIAVDGDASFLLSSGIVSHNSAISAFRKYRDPQKMGAFALRGKFVNVSEMSNTKLVQNKEFVNLMAAIGLKLGQPISNTNLRYGKIYFYVDADCLHKDTQIVTQNGKKSIESIQHEEMVLTHTGEFKPVKKIIQKEISRYIEIKIQNKIIKCSEDHKLIVVRNSDVIEIPAKELKETDFLITK
jgi:DNA gyrase/topoisomerase IV subunit B